MALTASSMRLTTARNDMPNAKQKSKMPVRKLWTTLLAAVLTAIAAHTALDLTPETISALSLSIGGLVGYYMPPADRDQIEEVT